MTKARATARGYYPVSPGGPSDIVEPGQVFDLVEGQTKGKWFEVLKEAKAKAPKPEEQKPEGDLT